MIKVKVNALRGMNIVRLNFQWETSLRNWKQLSLKRCVLLLNYRNYFPGSKLFPLRIALALYINMKING